MTQHPTMLRATNLLDPEPDADQFVDDMPTSYPEMPVLLSAPQHNIVDLPAGIVDPESGRVQRQVTVRELTGYDEEQLAKKAKAKINEYVEAIIACGTDPQLDSVTISNLLVGDRAALVLGIRIATFGTDMEMPDLECNNCTARFDLTLDLPHDIPTTTMEDPLGGRTFRHITRSGHALEFRLAVHADALAIDGLTKPTLAEINTLALERCLLTVDGVGKHEIQQTPDELVRNLGLADRMAILREMDDRQPGPRAGEVTIRCPKCDIEAPLPLDLAAMFRG